MAIIKFQAKLLEKRQIAQDTDYFKFSAPENFDFESGQFVSIRFQINGEVLTRAYSILNAPSNKGVVELIVKVVKGGKGSNLLHDTKIGEELEFLGPMGMFKYNKEDSNKEIYLLGTGTGLVPLYSMLKEHVNDKNKKFILYYGSRNKANQFLHEELIEIEKNNDNFDYKPILSREKWDGLQGHCQENLPKDLTGKTFYICGLKNFVTQTVELLESSGVSKENIHKERYN